MDLYKSYQYTDTYIKFNDEFRLLFTLHFFFHNNHTSTQLYKRTWAKKCMMTFSGFAVSGVKINYINFTSSRYLPVSTKIPCVTDYK